MKRLSAIAMVVALCACSGHTGGLVPRASAPGVGPSAPLSFAINIPLAPPGARAQHVSSGTLGVSVTTYAQSDTSHTTPIGYFGNDVSPASPQCTTGPVFRICSIQAAAPAGADELVVTTYDSAPNGSGAFAPGAKALDTGVVDHTMVEGTTNAVTVALNGVPDQVAVAIDNPNALFDPHLYAGIPYTIELTALDAGGATIIGSDAFASGIALSSSSGTAQFTIDGTPGTVVTKPNSTISMVDSSPARASAALRATISAGVDGTEAYIVDALGTTTVFATRSSPRALSSGTASDEVGQSSRLYYGDLAEEIVKFDVLTSTESALSYSGATPEAGAATAIVRNSFAPVDVSFVTASDGTDVWIGNSDGTGAPLGNTVPATANCALTNGSNGSRVVACGDAISDADTLSSSQFPGRTFGGIATGANGALFYTFDATGQGGIGTMMPADIGGSTDTVIDLPAGRYGTQLVACPNGGLYFIEIQTSDGHTFVGSDQNGVLGTLTTTGTTGNVSAIACGPNDDLYYGTDLGHVYRVPFGTGTAEAVASAGGAIGGLALGPDGAMWATDTPLDQLLRIIP